MPAWRPPGATPGPPVPVGGHGVPGQRLEPYRRRGCQSVLIQVRLADAAAVGCERVCVITEWDTQSHANVVRAGFRTVYTKAVWTLAG